MDSIEIYKNSVQKHFTLGDRRNSSRIVVENLDRDREQESPELYGSPPVPNKLRSTIPAQAKDAVEVKDYETEEDFIASRQSSFIFESQADDMSSIAIAPGEFQVRNSMA